MSRTLREEYIFLCIQSVKYHTMREQYVTDQELKDLHSTLIAKFQALKVLMLADTDPSQETRGKWCREIYTLYEQSPPFYFVVYHICNNLTVTELGYSPKLIIKLKPQHLAEKNTNRFENYRFIDKPL